MFWIVLFLVALGVLQGVIIFAPRTPFAAKAVGVFAVALAIGIVVNTPEVERLFSESCPISVVVGISSGLGILLGGSIVYLRSLAEHLDDG